MINTTKFSLMNLFIASAVIIIIFITCVQPKQPDGGGGGGTKTESSDSSASSSDASSSASSVFVQKPVVKSFTAADAIQIEWAVNPEAESYLLYKYDSPGCITELLEHETADISYTDSSVVNGQFYYYKLAYRISGAVTNKSEYSFGIASSLIKDSYEDNESEDNAVVLYLNNQSNANIYYYKDSIDNILADYDWYYIQVPAYTRYTAVFSSFSSIDNEDLYFNILSQSKVLINENDGFYLDNFTDTPVDIKFQVSVNSANFINEFGSYSITIVP